MYFFTFEVSFLKSKFGIVNFTRSVQYIIKHLKIVFRIVLVIIRYKLTLKNCIIK